MEIYKSDMDDIRLLDITGNEMELLEDGIAYIHSIIDKLYKKHSKSSYELFGVSKNPKEYRIFIRGGSYMYNHRTKGSILKLGIIYLKMVITYNNSGENPIILIDVIHANEDMLSGNTIIDIAKNFGMIIKANQLFLDDASGLNSVCMGSHFSLTTLYILSVGMSWYNTKGFLSPYFDEEQRHNTHLLSLNIVDFLLAQREYTYKYLQVNKSIDMNNLEQVTLEKSIRMDKFIQDMTSFFDFFENYDDKYPFIEDIGLFLHKDMTVQDFFTRIKLFILRVLPKNRPPLYKLLCSQLKWLFDNIDFQYIDEDESGEQITSESFNPNVIIYYTRLYYNVNEPIIPSPLNYNISRRKTLIKTMSLGKSKKRKSSVKKSKTRRGFTIG